MTGESHLPQSSFPAVSVAECLFLQIYGRWHSQKDARGEALAGESRAAVVLPSGTRFWSAEVLVVMGHRCGDGTAGRGKGLSKGTRGSGVKMGVPGIQLCQAVSSLLPHSWSSSATPGREGNSHASKKHLVEGSYSKAHSEKPGWVGLSASLDLPVPSRPAPPAGRVYPH